MKKRFFSMMTTAIFFIPLCSFGAPQFKVNMRVGLRGQSPISVNTIAKSGKKSFISQFSDDGQTETLIELFTRKSQVNNRNGLFMDVAVKKRVRGSEKVTERAQLFVPEDEELQFGEKSTGRSLGDLSIAVMAHQL
jgi:hypothetical protein